MNFNAALERVERVTVDIGRLRQIEGWLTDEAADLTGRLTHLQRALGQANGVLELGVYKGKYLALLSALYERENIPVVGIDGFLARLGEPLEPRWRASAEDAIRANVQTITRTELHVTLLGGLTRDVDVADVKALCPDGYGFVSVDAGHEADDLIVDLGITAAASSPDAIIAVDDVFNPLVPGVVDGVCRFFQRRPNCDLLPFAICGNKVFFAAGRMHATYLEFCQWLLATATDTPYISNSAINSVGNRQNNFIPRFLGHEIVAFAWN